MENSGFFSTELVKVTSDTIEKFSFLDDIEGALRFPNEFVEVDGPHIQPLSTFYLNIRQHLMEEGSGDDYLELFRSLYKYVDGDEILADHLRLQQESIEQGIDEFVASAMNARMRAVIVPFSKNKARVANFVSLLNWGVPISHLFREAAAGDDLALDRLLQVDKSALVVGPIARRVTILQLGGDWGRLESMGKAIAASPLSARREVPKAVAVVGFMWEEHFSKIKFREVVGLLREYGVLPNLSNYDYFRKQLYGFGLKKSRYNRK